jgi:LAS superfamily LD-carboxypeptidase LdcB
MGGIGAVHGSGSPWVPPVACTGMTVAPAELTGQTDAHLCTAADAGRLGVRVHRAVVDPFLRLQSAARDAGFDLQILSGFRGFDEQSSIWNRKATGKRAVLDSNAVPLDITRLSPEQLVFTILRWSALPGASRHHWGTDLDVYDRAAQPAGYEIELIPDEVNPGGMFGPLHAWLDERIASGTAFGFFRPYDRDRGGVAPERWHLSYGPVAAPWLRQLTVGVLRDTVAAADLQLRDVVLEHLDRIHKRFVLNTNRFDA